MLKTYENSSKKTVAEQSMSLQTPLGSVMEFSRRCQQKIWTCAGLLHHDVPTQTFLKTAEFVTNNNIIIPHPPYLPDLAPCDFALFPKLKMKRKGWRFETVSDIQRELQVVLDSIRENDFHGVLEALKKQLDRCIRS
jgi:hypothetical protein